jgi:hypothetical protein
LPPNLLGQRWTMPIPPPVEPPDPDWTGVAPDRTPIERLLGAWFTIRLQRLGDRAGSLTMLRRAWSEQRSHGQQPALRTTRCSPLREGRSGASASRIPPDRAR